MQAKNRELKTFLFDHMYRHHRVYRMQVKAEKILAELFEAYTQHPAMLPEEIQAKASGGNFYRVIADYIAGMTDRFALDEHSRRTRLPQARGLSCGDAGRLCDGGRRVPSDWQYRDARRHRAAPR
jgi:hypothetical protein